ncbi:peptidase S8 [Thalassotalea sp. HSM 43]|uniref:S8 family serine peptidase n=1 Tax=Thalassotalea sp. HSM 43 TaxID=2552945 RepID=UPI00108072C9|nr:S8 family serine peptidase [Thalassotalea sp. HSM 43]QBY02930.1 peptidase S8 [Thalassotalea sp. HSM 43]
MKVKSIALSVVTALYAASVGATMTDNSAIINQGTSTLKKLDLNNTQLKQLNQTVRKTALANNNVLKRAGSVNMHLNPKSSVEKFIEEPDISGVHTYIIQMIEQPVTTYKGGIDGLKATAVNGELRQANAKLFNKNVNKTDINAYKGFLKSKQNDLINSLAVQGLKLDVRKQFTTALNGFSVNITQQQAKVIAQNPQVLNIKRSRLYQLNTDVGPQLIGADKIWNGNVTENNTQFRGEGIVVGILDTGINTDHPSFAAVGGDGYAHTNPLGADNYIGDCAKQEFAYMCNDKLIGVRSYDVITDAYSAPEFQDEFWQDWMPAMQIRPKNGEDYNGHGSHTASTTAGNVLLNVPHMFPQIGDGDGVLTGLDMGTISGVAPHANIISYQVCYPGGAGDAYAGCPGEALVAGIEDAIEDGVDVINFSIGGSEALPWNDPFELAFLSAREAGIVVAASAGNSGSDGYNEIMASSDHASPWLLTVGATTTGRTIDVTGKQLENLSGGDTSITPSWQAAGISEAFTGNIVLAADYGDELCLQPFPIDTFTSDQIVVCKRGVIARVEKASNVAAGGAGGFVLYNINWDDSLNDDVYAIPGVHIDYNAQWSLIPWLQSGTGHMATITASNVAKNIDESNQDMLAAFSSRGPSKTNPEHLIPSISAPGVDIYAANADEHPFSAVNVSSKYISMSGTSMAAPHVTGVAALIKQARPEWTASEIQSAIMMTANQSVTFDAGWPDGVVPAGIYRAGSGRIDAAAAISSGLIMNETAENFMLANPTNGGDVKALNMPELVNFNCKGVCSWVRTFEATHDGSWSVETETGEYSVAVKATPANFDLKAGEKVSILFEASIIDSQTAIGNSEVEVHGKVFIKEANQLSPNNYLPLALKYNGGELPENINISAYRNNDVHTVKGLTAGTFTNLNVSSYAPVAATLHSVTLPQDTDFNSPFADSNLDDATQTLWLDVPANSKRLITEVLSLDESTAEEDWIRGDLDVIVGYDVNNDGMVQMDEAICVSFSEYDKDFCNINNPEQGKYWVVLHNWKKYWESYPRPIDSYTVATAIVTDQVAMDVIVSGPESNNGVDTFDLDIEWNKDMVEGDVFYGAFELGTDNINTNNIGLVPYRLNRKADDVQLNLSQTTAKAGDIIDVSLSVRHNASGVDRVIDLASELPEGLSFVPNSASLAHSGVEQLIIENNTLTITGVQRDTSTTPIEYIITTNLDDAMCKTPSFGLADHDGGYFDLLSKVGFGPDWGGIWNENLTLEFSALWGEELTYSMYNNSEYHSYPTITMSPQGYLQFDELPLFFPFNMPFPMASFPDAMIAPLWKGVFFGQSFGTPYEPNFYSPDDNAGMTFAYTEDKTLIVEWDNVRSQSIDFNWFTQETTVINNVDRYDFQTIINLGGYNHGENQYEIIMAYDNLDFAGETAGTVGVHSFSGVRTPFGPIEGYKGSQYAFDNIDEKLSNDLVICYDYSGPEISEIMLQFQVRVDDNASGKNLMLNINSAVEGIESMKKSAEIKVNGNLTLAPMNDVTIDENSTSDDIAVIYADAQTSANEIIVSGDNFTTEINGNAAGSTFIITPEMNFHGETEVTVTVQDAVNSADKAVTTFMLTVVSDGIELGCMDSSATNFDADANTDDGSCEFPAELAAKEESSDSGGAVWWMLIALSASLLARQKLTANK